MSGYAFAESKTREEQFLDWFSQSFKGRGLSSEFSFGKCAQYCVSFSESINGSEIAGHGYASTKFEAALKGAAEFIERLAMVRYYEKNSAISLQNSNGWAVHFSESAAKESAYREALERHILNYTFIRSGWSEFVLADQITSENGEALFLVSPYIVNGHFAGIVVYKDKTFPGVSLGYLADRLENLKDSQKWNHALFEAICYVKRGIEAKSFSLEQQDPLAKLCFAWLTDPWTEKQWQVTFEPKILPYIPCGIASGLVADLCDSWEGLYYARVEPGFFIPFFIQEDLPNLKNKVFVEDSLRKFGLELPHERLPIL